MKFFSKRLRSQLGDKSIRIIFDLLPIRDRFLLVVVILFTFVLALLDLLGVLLIGVIGSLSVTGLGSVQTGDRVSIILRIFRIDDLDFETQILIIGLVAVILLFTKTLLSLIIVRKSMFFMASRAAVISSDLIRRYFTIPISGVNQRTAHNSIYALTTGVDAIMVGVIGSSIALISDFVLLLVLMFGLYVVDPISASGALLLFGILTVFLYVILQRRVRLLGERQGILSIVSSQNIYEAINCYRELIVRNRRGFYAQKIGSFRYELAQGRANINFMGTISKYILEMALVIGGTILVFYQLSTTSAFRAIATITVFMAASSRIIPALVRIQQGSLGIRSALAQASSTISLVRELANTTYETFESNGFTRVHFGFQSRIVAENMTFSYDGSNEVIKQVNFRAEPGEFIAIVGGSGAGKTTLVDLLLGAQEIQTGSVELSGVRPLVAFSRWPGAVSYVPQETIIIDGTVKANLTLGYLEDEISDEHCWASLEIAQLDAFIKSQPNQLQNYVGDRGTRLSGGQRQRLGIARALITSPKLLILDEATSALDATTESEISASLRGLKGEVTLIVIAHRLSTVVDADRIYFLKDGLVKGVGTFDQLKLDHPEFLSQAELMGL